MVKPLSCVLLLSLAWCVVAVLPADAQVTVGVRSGNRAAVRTGVGVGLGMGWWGGGWNPGYTGSTPAESYARGQAELIRAQGAAFQAAAAGAVDFEQARAAYLENKLRWQQVRDERQAMGQQRRAEEAAAQRAARERRAAANPPSPGQTGIPDVQYDEATGTVSWPEVLQGPDFATGRMALEDLFKVKAHTGGTSDVNQQILESATNLRTQLKSEVRNLPPSGYIEARRFLDQVVNSVRSA